MAKNKSASLIAYHNERGKRIISEILCLFRYFRRRASTAIRVDL